MKKLISVILAVLLIVPVCGFTVGATDSSNEASCVETLSALGILIGDESGDLNLDKNITRAEFSTIITRILGIETADVKEVFTDVSLNHWANSAVNTCYNLGIINGYGNGAFGPEDFVTYEQAVKMIVCVLGYEPMAAQKGGYPTGYLAVANMNELTENVNTQATRGDIVHLIFNALDIPMMEQAGFGTEITYEILDGTNNKAYKTLLSEMDVAKLEGYVIGTPIIEHKKDTKVENGYVMYRITEDNDNEYFKNKVDVEFSIANGVNASDYFGYASVIYVKETYRNKYEIISIMPSENSTILEFGIEDIDAVNENSLDYYISDYDTKTLRFEKDVKVYKNYKVSNLQEAIKDNLNSNEDIEITIIESTDNNKYDMVIVKEYAYDRIESVEVNRDRFTTNSIETFNFDFDDDSKIISIVDADGAPISLADFAEDDVIAYISSNNKGKNYDWIEIINLGHNVVTGEIDEQNDDCVFIDGNEYGVIESADISLGDEGTFYLTRTNKIFASEKSSSAAGNYAYILATTLDSNNGWEKAWQVKLLTKNNEIVTYTVRDGFTIDDSSSLKQDDATSATKILQDLDVSKDVAIDSAVSDRIITYKLDSKGYIKEICSVNASLKFTDEEYEEDAQYLKTDIENDTIVFNISGGTETSVYVTSVNSLVNENLYDGYYITNDKSEVDCLVITKGGNEIDYTQDFAVVASVTDITLDEGATNAKKVRYYSSNDEEIKEIVIADDADISVAKAGTTYSNVIAGAIMMFTEDANGIASAYMVIATAVPDGINSDAVAAISADKNADTEIVVGYISDYSKVNNGTKIVIGTGDNLVIKNVTNTYTIYDASANKLRVHVGDWSAVDTIDKEDETKATYFIAKKTKSTVTDFITYSTRKDK